jgi:ubiquinone/menaquinone biosynthesis C-methylase UbiE
MRQFRIEALAGLTGRVVELGPGNGTSFRLYPPSVEEVVAVEPEPYLRARALSAADRAEVTVHVVEGRAEAIPVQDGWADAVVCALVLCSVEDLSRTLAEIRRVLRPGGELRLFEHVGAHNRAGQACLHTVEVAFWRRAFGNCQPTRHTLTAIQDAGFDTSAVRRVMQPFPPLPHVVGVARAV